MGTVIIKGPVDRFDMGAVAVTSVVNVRILNV